MIQVRELSKTYRVARKAAGLKASLAGLFRRQWEDVLAVKSISFRIGAGERVGFLGPNGAGKTTTLKMLSGLLAPTSGELSVLGLDPRTRPRDLLRQITLVMGQKQQLIWDLPPVETFELNRAVYEIDRAEYARTLEELITLLEIGELIEKPTRQLSLGERMKCELAAALIHRPKVLFLDEPTIGLDVTMQVVIRDFIRRYNESNGATVLLTSHYMDDVTALCPRVIVIDRGAIRHDGDLTRLVQATNPDKLISVNLSRSPSELESEVLRQDALSGRVREVGPMSLEIRVPPDRITDIVRRLIEALPVADLKVEDPPLEDIMRQVFGNR